MGEDRDATQDATQDRVTIQEAARRLGIKEDAIRKRIQRGTLRYEKAEGGRVYVWVDVTQDSRQTSQDTAQDTAQDERFVDLREQVGYLRRQLDEEREARRRADTIIAQLARANEEQARTIRELEAPSEGRESPEKAEKRPEGAEDATGGAQEGTERPQQRNGWLAPVEKLPWWHYGLGLLLVFLGSYLAVPLEERVNELMFSMGFAWSVIPNAATLFGVGWTPSVVFGFWVGFRRRDPRLRSEIIRFGVLVGVTLALGPLGYYMLQGPKFGTPPPWFWLVYTAATVLPGWLLYVSGALIGNSRQRRHTGRMTGTTPVSPLLRTTVAPPEPQADWTPRKQALLGFAGTVIAALISLMGTAMSVLASSGG